jgi:hypothetical protein
MLHGGDGPSTRAMEGGPVRAETNVGARAKKAEAEAAFALMSGGPRGSVRHPLLNTCIFVIEQKHNRSNSFSFISGPGDLASFLCVGGRSAAAALPPRRSGGRRHRGEPSERAAHQGSFAPYSFVVVVQFSFQVIVQQVMVTASKIRDMQRTAPSEVGAGGNGKDRLALLITAWIELQTHVNGFMDASKVISTHPSFP